MVQLDEIYAAKDRIADGIEKTEVLQSEELDQITGHHVFFKAENRQKTGSFKIRGALNAVLITPNVKGFIAFSSGNHGKALAYASKLAGKPVVIVMPEDTPEYKKTMARNYGADVVTEGITIENRIQRVADLTEETGYEFISPFDDERVMAGQGTISLELIEQIPDVEAILVAVGGGGMISGVGSAMKQLKPEVEIIGVEPEVANDAQMSLERGKRVRLEEIPNTIADSVRTMVVGEKTFPIMQEVVDRIVTVPEEITEQALQLIEEKLGERVEPTAALTFAPLLMDYDLPDKVAVILCGKAG